jgi:hypothetical protein
MLAWTIAVPFLFPPVPLEAPAAVSSPTVARVAMQQPPAPPTPAQEYHGIAEGPCAECWAYPAPHPFSYHSVAPYARHYHFFHGDGCCGVARGYTLGGGGGLGTLNFRN